MCRKEIDSFTLNNAMNEYIERKFQELKSPDERNSRIEQLDELKSRWKVEFMANDLDIDSIQDFCDVFYEDGDDTDSSDDYDDDSEYDSEDETEEGSDDEESDEEDEDVIETLDIARFFATATRDLE